MDGRGKLRDTATAMKTTPKTMWWTWISPAVRFPGHHRTLARMSRTDSRMKPKPTTNATKKQNNGSRPVCTICAENQPDMSAPTWRAAVTRQVDNRFPAGGPVEREQGGPPLAEAGVLQ